jgi:hypothetical protein
MSGKDKEREERLAAALRENLRRRKAQGRQLKDRTAVPDDDPRFDEGMAILGGPNALSDWQHAVDLIDAAAEGGHPEAIARRAVFECRGVGRESDWDRALDSLALAAESGSEWSARQLLVLAEGRFDPATPFPGPGNSWNDLRARISLQQLMATPQPQALSNDPLILAVPAIATAAECQWLIAAAGPRLRAAEVYQHGIDPGRTNRFAPFSFANQDLVSEVFRTRIAQSLGAPQQCLEVSQVLHYDVGQEFVLHCDFLDPRALAQEIARNGQRIVTVLIYLNEDFEGGATSFPRLGIDHRAKTGDALMFRNVDRAGQPDPRTQHAGLAPTRGEKWVFSQWVRNREPS